MKEKKAAEKPDKELKQQVAPKEKKEKRAKMAKSDYVPRLKAMYTQEIIPAMVKEFSLTNPYQVPRLEKIVLNMGVGEATQNPKALEGATADLMIITGQKPLITKARKSIAGFKVRAKTSIGTKVTLRGNRMYEFLDRLISTALPRIRDFRGLGSGSFDGSGNFTLGIDEQLIFPEIDYDKIDKVRGANITIVTTAYDNSQALALLKHFGMPFKAGPPT